MLREVLGQSFQGFADSRDGGRDGAFYGLWDARGQTAQSFQIRGATVLQCKHTAVDANTLTLSSVRDDLEKVSRLVMRGLCDSYILMSNARLTAESEDAIVTELRKKGVAFPVVLGGGWMAQTIAHSRTLRMFVPRIYGLGDLSQILDERVYAQASHLINYLRPELSTFVVTSAYRNAAKALRSHGLVVLLGEPAAGKSVIAATLAMTALDSWGCAAVRAHDARELLDHWNPGEPNQLFWVDDAFGSVRHDWNLTQGWAQRMPAVMAAIKSGAKLILTSRDYIYRDARPYVKEYAFPLLVEQQVVVDLGDLSRDEREKILYNHIKLGDQPAAYKTALKPFLARAALANPFRPEAARRLGHSAFTPNLSMDEASVVEFVEKPKSFLAEVYSQLDPPQLAALCVVFAEGVLVPPVDERSDIRPLVERLGTSSMSIGAALEALEGTFVRYGATPLGEDDVVGWSFHHPTLREGFAELVGHRPDLLDVFIAGVSDDALLTEIDCGSAGQGQLVSVPSSLYLSVARRVRAARLGAQQWQRRQAINQFLYRRTSDDFLRVYLGEDPAIVDALMTFGSFLSAQIQPKLLARLHQLGLLAEPDRLRAVATVRDLAVSTPDADWIDAPEWRILMTEGDRLVLLEAIQSDLVPALEREIEEWRDSYDKEDDPYDHFEPLLSPLRKYRSALGSYPEAVRAFEDALEAIDGVLDDLRERFEQRERPDEDDDIAPPEIVLAASERSVFDDVDE